ncbi:MAG: helix-turn-helix transcriptional regulator [Myxococcales bacterium]|nr:helix-turn-helix transcriptional regulator [Myxococcales bacterium]
MDARTPPALNAGNIAEDAAPHAARRAPLRRHESFGEILYRRRKELGLTQSVLAARIGVQPNYIVYLEKGERRPSDRTVRRMAEALQLDAGDLFLAANPQVREFLRLDQPPETRNAELPVGLQALIEDTETCVRMGVTEDEIALASQLRLSGRVTNARQYLALILAMRYIFS